MSLEKLAAEVAAGRITARQLVEQSLEKVEATKGKRALLAIYKDKALKRADQIDADVANGKSAGRLAGVPFIAKDNMLTYGGKTTAAAKILDNFEAPFQATAIERLEAEGAILIGKANLDAFAHGGSTENSAYSPTKHPLDDNKVPGGSSGGSAAAVALDIAPFALGTDTGGSIRQPASFTGVVGFKPTYGTVSRYGVVAMASSTDVVGPLTKTAADADLIMQIIAGHDPKDSVTLVDFYDQLADKKPGKLGLVKQWFDEADAGVKRQIEQAVDKLKDLGWLVEPVDMPLFDQSLAAYYVIVPAEVASNLARYDGVRYGVRAEADNLNDMYRQTREAGFMPENKRRIMIGNYVLSSGYYDAYYKQAAKVRTLIIQKFDEAFAKYDFLIGAVSAETAFEMGRYVADPLKMYLSDLMTVPASLAGVPGVSLPVGLSDGMPVGLQVVGPAKSDRSILKLAEQIEKEIN
ncbi:MAG TPA: Asp-tRNA(Asn)/Glu-tRNA(Gln) amidotransferase subunit GatA [Candidatus Saccharimonadales bacterium]|nr:Asp-tRNA(Asn)/Glu-tRNA(Gln) amidotransferase subunit GatA [Candidatus Saccharimonadales bacterium]